jgi:DMSO/TMAO reductase YedYZ molybdopterin-dependent catalytic subunit
MSQLQREHLYWAALGRRDFLQGAAAFALPPLSTAAVPLGSASGPAEAPSFPGLILREREPQNLEFPFASLDGFLVLTERFYVRNHFPVPRPDVKHWRLKVEGAVGRPLELSYEALTGMASRTQVALLECAGNGRAFLTPKAKGVPWELGAVGNAEWTGVPLAAVLDRAGVRPGAVEVVLEGADEGEITEEPKSPGRIHFARSLPLEKARRPEVLLAYRMNGKELPPAHGYPLRAVVAGWYGMASVKWLRRIVVTERPFRGYFQALDYTCFERRHGLPSLVPVTELEVKAQVARPARHEVIPAGSPYRIHGAAWAGEAEVAKVEVSTDGGKTWAEARLLGEAVPYSWRLWEYGWRAPGRAGPVTVLARATDRRGRVQAMRHDPDRRGYKISHVLPAEAAVR